MPMTELGRLDGSSASAANLPATRATCRNVLESVRLDDCDMVRHANRQKHWATWTLYSALGEMRGNRASAPYPVSDCFPLGLALQ